MKTKELSTSLYLDTFVPLHVREQNPAFITFLKAYYDWAEQTGNLHNVAHTFGEPSNKLFVEEYYRFIKSEYLSNYPEDYVIDKFTFLKVAKQIYSSKGIPESIKFFFKSIFNEEIEILYPSDRSILAFHRKETYLCTVQDNLTFKEVQKIVNLKGRFIRQENQGALAYVESVFYESDFQFTAEDIGLSKPILQPIKFFIRISNKKFDDFVPSKKTFLCSENGIPLLEDPNYTEFFLQTQLGNVKIINAGTGYQVGDILDIPDTIVNETQEPVIRRTVARIAKTNLSGAIEKIVFDVQGISQEETYYVEKTTSNVGQGATIMFFPTVEFDRAQNYLFSFTSENVHKYIIRSAIPSVRWKNIFEKIVHPAGIQYEAELRILSNNLQQNNLTLFKSGNGDVNYKDPEKKSSRKYFEAGINVGAINNVKYKNGMMSSNNEIGTFFVNTNLSDTFNHVTNDLTISKYFTSKVKNVLSNISVSYNIDIQKNIQSIKTVNSQIEISYFNFTEIRKDYSVSNINDYQNFTIQNFNTIFPSYSIKDFLQKYSIADVSNLEIFVNLKNSASTITAEIKNIEFNSVIYNNILTFEKSTVENLSLLYNDLREFNRHYQSGIVSLNAVVNDYIEKQVFLELPYDNKEYSLENIQSFEAEQITFVNSSNTNLKEFGKHYQSGTVFVSIN